VGWRKAPVRGLGDEVPQNSLTYFDCRNNQNMKIHLLIHDQYVSRWGLRDILEGLSLKPMPNAGTASICMWCCSVVVWNVAKKEAVCGSPAQAPSSGLTHAVAYSNTSDDVFITGGKSVTLFCTISSAV